MTRNRRARNLLGRNLKSDSRPDVMTRETRSKLMAKVKSADTGLEAKFIAVLEAAKVSGYEMQAKDLIGKPDVVFRQQRVCIFVDSNFWHGWQFPRWKHKLRSSFWVEKITKNRERDLRVSRQLRNDGWKVMRVWEHQISTAPEKVLYRVQSALAERQDEQRPTGE